MYLWITHKIVTIFLFEPHVYVDDQEPNVYLNFVWVFGVFFQSIVGVLNLGP